MKYFLAMLLLNVIVFSVLADKRNNINILQKSNDTDRGLFSTRQEQNVNAMEKQAIFMIKSLFDKIINQQEINKQDEEFYFGPHGGILGDSIQSNICRYNVGKSSSATGKNQKSILGILLSKKLYDILKDKKRFSFALASRVRTIDRENIPRSGIMAEHLLIVRAIPLTNKKYFNDIGNGINFVFAINYTSNAKDSICIELINSYVNGMPFYKFLGFYGDYASGLKISYKEVEKFFHLKY